jgi:hypothetical protein
MITILSLWQCGAGGDLGWVSDLVVPFEGVPFEGRGFVDEGRPLHEHGVRPLEDI